MNIPLASNSAGRCAKLPAGRTRKTLRVCVLLILLAAIPPIWFAGCGGYAGMVFRENMLKPTPYMKVADKPDPRTWPSDAVTVTWIGHATVLINLRGVTILTDPVLYKRIAPPELFGANFGIRRITEVAVPPDKLPPIDLVLLSHAHYDHWDDSSLRRFNAETSVIIPSGTRDLLPSGHFGEVRELRWQESAQVKGITVTAIPVQHWGMRGRESTPRGYSGYLIEGGGTRVFFAGDSAFNHWSLEKWREYVGAEPVDLCLLPIGDSYYRGNHMSPEEAWSLSRAIGGGQLLPIHWRTFIQSPPSKEPTFSPITRLKAAAGAEAFRIVGAEPGEVVTIAGGTRQ